MLSPASEAYEGHVMVQHSEAVYFVRKQILERAKHHWKDASAISPNYVLGMTERR